MSDFKDLKKIASTGYYNYNASQLPDFVGKGIDISPNMKRKMVTNINPDEYIAKAWEIPKLTNMNIEVQNESNLFEIMFQIISDLGNIDLSGLIETEKGVINYLIFPLRKYHILHLQRSSCLVSEYNTPMCIDIYGTITSIGGYEEGSKEAEEIHCAGSYFINKPISTPFTIKIINALWSNVGNPRGCFYL